MKKRLGLSTYLVLLAFVWGGALAGSFLYSYCIESQLFVQEAHRIWGHKKFEAKKFKKASLDERFAMSANLIEKKYGMGWQAEQLVSVLGQPDKHNLFLSRWSQIAFGYKLQDRHNPWRLVFYYDKKQIVTHIRIEKEYRAPDMMYSRVGMRLLKFPYQMIVMLTYWFKQI